MKHISRRKALQLFSSVPVAPVAIVWTSAETEAAQTQAQAARRQATERGTPFQPEFFTRREYATVTVLADLILPRDERSGSATDAGVPEFMDFMMIDQPVRQTAMRGGLAWLDLECQDRFDKTFVDCRAEQRTAVLDDISWPQRAQPAMMHGVDFFNNFRNLTSTGFWTTKTGMADLQYMGNTFVAEWKGCPDEVLKKLGVSAGD